MTLYNGYRASAIDRPRSLEVVTQRRAGGGRVATITPLIRYISETGSGIMCSPSYFSRKDLDVLNLTQDKIYHL